MGDLALVTIAKIIAILAGVFSIKKAFLGVSLEKKKALRSDFEFAGKVISDGKWAELHDYQLELGCLAVSGQRLDASEVRYFLSQKDPSRKLRDYAKGQRNLEPCSGHDGVVRSFKYRGRLANPSRYKIKYYFYYIGYFFFASISLLPVFFVAGFMTKGFSGLFPLVGWMFSFGLVAYVFLDEVWALQAAERVVNATKNNNRVAHDNESK